MDGGVVKDYVAGILMYGTSEPNFQVLCRLDMLTFWENDTYLEPVKMSFLK